MRGALLLVLSLLLAGCVKQPEAEAEPLDTLVLPAASVAPTTGTLVVTTLFQDHTPLTGVRLALGNASALSDEQGVARFSDLPEGDHTLLATKSAHRDAQQLVTVRAGEETRAEVVLLAEEGGQHSHKVGFTAHADVYVFDGHFDCSAQYVIITGDCLILVSNVSDQAGIADPAAGATSERNVIDFPLDVNWSALVVEMTWNASDAPASDGMTLALEPAEAPVDGHAAKYARVDGSDGLRIELTPGIKHATATEEDMPNPQGGEVIRARAFVRGHSHHPGGTDLLGVGAAKDFPFRLYVSTFYGEPAPDAYTAIR